LAQETVVEVLAKFRADTAEFNRRLTEVQSQLDALSKKTQTSSTSVESSFNAMSASVGKLTNALGAVSAVAGTAMVALGVQSFNAASKVQEFDTVLQIIGSTTGIGYDKLVEYTKAVKDNGIEMAAAQQLVINFARNNLNVADAVTMSRVAQDLAVISQSNSTETATRLMYAVLRLNTQMLRNAGTQVTVESAVRKYAAANNIAVASLTTAQKQQAVMNAVIAEGATLTGVYTMSMQNAGKVLRSFSRITTNIQVALGGPFLDAFGPLILAVYNMYSAFSKTIEKGGALYPIIQALSAVFVQLATPVTNLVIRFTDLIKNMQPITTSIDDMGTMIQKYLPVIGAFGAAMATSFGAQLLTAVPVFGAFFKMLSPLGVGLAVLVALSPKVQEAFGKLGVALKPQIEFLGKLVDIAVTAGNVLTNVLASAMSTLANVINFVNGKFEDMNGLLEITATVVLAMVIAQTVLLTKKTYLLIAAKAKEAAAFLVANAKILLASAAIAVLIYAFYKAWNSSEALRKAVLLIGEAFIYIGELARTAASLTFNAFALIVRGSANAQIALGKLMGNKEMQKTGKETLNWIDKTNASITDFGDTLKNASAKLDTFNKPISFKTDSFTALAGKIKEIFKGEKVDTGINEPTTTGGSEAITNNLREVLQKYNDFINNEFARGFQKDSETAKDTIMKSLDMLKNVFDEQAKGLKGSALKNLQDAYWKTNEAIRQFIPDAEKIGAKFEELNKEIEKATKRLEDATKNRLEAVDAFAELLRQPFGEPSAITKAMGSAESTVDSIISMYDNLVEQINKRYDGIDPTGRDNLVNFLTNQTERLVSLARKRLKVAKQLEDAQAALSKVMQEQESFVGDAKNSMKSYASALVDLSQSDAAATIEVIKTANGLVITQMKTATSGIDTITKQLRERLQTIKDFAANIKKLLSRGVNKDYIKQLIQAGPEAAGAVAAALANASDTQLSEINAIYAEIGSVSDSFANDMGSEFFDAAVKSAQALKDGFAKEMEAIDAEMKLIVDAIAEALSPLSDLGTNLGADLAQGFLDELNKRKTELVTLAESIATAISEAMAKALGQIGVADAMISPKTNAPAPAPVLDRDNKFYNWTPDSTTLNGDLNINVNTPDATTFADDLPGIMSKALLGRR
jgi:hypothetical protein